MSHKNIYREQVFGRADVYQVSTNCIWVHQFYIYGWKYVKPVSSRSFGLTRMTFKVGEVRYKQAERILRIKMKLFVLLMASFLGRLTNTDKFLIRGQEN